MSTGMLLGAMLGRQGYLMDLLLFSRALDLPMFM